MKLSIVTISFNQANYLERSIESVINQDYPNIEYIIVDPGSTDGSRDIIEKYRDRIAKIIYEPDQGPGDGLNKGFSFATGDIYGYLNSDDTLMPGALKYIAEQFENNPSVDVISGHAYIVDKEDNIVHKVFSHPFSLASYAVGCCVLVQQSTFFKPAIFARIGGFNKSNKLCWDGELMVDMALNGAKFKLVRKFLSCFRIYDDSITGSGQQVGDKYREQHQKIVNKILTAGVKPLPRKVEWLLTRIKDPLSTIDRVIDGFVHKKRLV
ncbi:glycosyltransferase family 2 protein [Methylomonas rosea]|uniref:Glycosyltransferase n=1 Tax=Methylomonas rosea TaxID=2952227 RepID=A0ABT1U025_9GAMM|nr:glycosyltransferase family 2 protein [Methylomonas sp. WSC-7]MCQ8119703.1 glycosyltransferase [Methylomonas sp. WSC-7]